MRTLSIRENDGTSQKKTKVAPFVISVVLFTPEHFYSWLL